MRAKYSFFPVVLAAASIAGMVLSAVLIFEYYGITPDVADAVCSKGHTGVNACTVVSASRFAAVKGIPYLKEIPVAAAGFAFYGFILCIVLLNFLRKEKTGTRPLLAFIAILSGIAFSGDMVLYLVSIFIIKFVCPLCVMTYILTLIILTTSIYLYRKNSTFNPEALSMGMKLYFKKEIVKFIIIAAAVGVSAIGIGSGARLMAEKKESVSYDERIDRAVREYETAEIIYISKENIPVIGNRNAPAQFTVFFDYTCSHCMEEIALLEKLIKKYSDLISVSFKFLPLNGVCEIIENGRDDEAAEGCIAATAAYSAHLQKRFIEYSNLLFESYHNKDMKLTRANVRELAKKNKLNMKDFERDFTSDKTKLFIKGEYDESEKLKIESTPTVYLNGKLLSRTSMKADIIEGLVQYCKKRGR